MYFVLLQDKKEDKQDKKHQVVEPQETEDKSIWKVTHQREEDMSKGQKKKQKKREKCEQCEIHVHSCFHPVIVMSFHLIDVCNEIFMDNENDCVKQNCIVKVWLQTWCSP